MKNSKWETWMEGEWEGGCVVPSRTEDKVMN